MDTQFWHKCWETGTIFWQQKKVNPFLEKYGLRFSPGQILVPLCGDSTDMDWLRDAGHEVLGVELSSIACRAYFEKRNLPITETTHGEFKVFTSGKVSLWCGDIFNLSAEDCIKVSGVYDRAALVALPGPIRIRYVELLNKFFTAKPVNNLLITFDYPQEQMSGPPFAIGDGDVRDYFGAAADIQPLEDLVTSPSPWESVPSVTERVYWVNYGRL